MNFLSLLYEIIKIIITCACPIFHFASNYANKRQNLWWASLPLRVGERPSNLRVVPTMWNMETFLIRHPHSTYQIRRLEYSCYRDLHKCFEKRSSSWDKVALLRRNVIYRPNGKKLFITFYHCQKLHFLFALPPYILLSRVWFTLQQFFL